MMVAGSLLLLGVFFNLGLLVSSLTHRSSTSVVILLLLWVFLALAFPRISTMIAEGVIPTRSDMVVHLEKTIKQDEILDSQEKELEDIWREISGSDNLWVPISSDSTEWNPQVRMFWDRKTEIEKRYQERVDTDLGRIDQEHLNRKQRQAGLAMSLSRLSPVSCYAYAMSELAGTGLSEETMLKNDARRFHRDVKDRVYSKVYEIQFRSSHSRSYGSFGEGHVPRYAETSDSLSDRIASAGMDLFLLCLYNLILLTAAYVAFLRYDVR
jgi:ABC-type transport system involved in multi-copper enzyme maturation permease subunit